MKFNIIFCFVLSALCVSTAFAQKRVLIVDGACYKDALTIQGSIDNTARLVKDFSQKKYQVRIAYGDAFSSLYEAPIINELNKISQKIKKSTAANIFNELNNVLEMNRNDDFIFFIGSHGSPKTSYSSHAICVYNEMTNNIDYLYIDDSVLKYKLKAIKDKGINITILDDSCYGGHASIELSQFGCVLTSTGPDIINMIMNSVGPNEVSGTSFAANIMHSIEKNIRITSEELWQIILVNSISSSNNPQSNNEKQGIAVGKGFGVFSDKLTTILGNIVEKNWDKFTMNDIYPEFYSEVYSMNVAIAGDLKFKECISEENKINSFANLKIKFPEIFHESNFYQMTNTLSEIISRMNS